MTAIKNEKLDKVIKTVQGTGLKIYAAIGKYKKVCHIESLPEETLIAACEDYLKYKDRIKGKHWPYFIRVLHSKYQTWKPQEVCQRTSGQMMSIQDILAKMMVV